LVTLGLVVMGWVGASPAAASLFFVTNEAEYRQALADLSADDTGLHVILLEADFTVGGASDPVYSGVTPLTIDGKGHTISVSAGRRALLNAGGPSLTVKDVSVRGGDAGRGGAIRSEGSGPVVIEDARFEDNSAATVGGALDVFGPLTVRNSVFVRNRAQLGAAIRAASLVLEDSWLTGNVGRDSTILTGDLTIDRSVVSVNEGRSVVESFEDPTDTHLTSSTFERNGGEVLTRGDAPGQVHIADSRFVDNDGGAISASHQYVAVENSLFQENRGENGGAIWALDTDIDTSSFVRNRGGSGGAVQVEEALHASNTTFAQNNGGVAGAISGGAAHVSLLHVTVDENETLGDLGSVLARRLVTRASYFGHDALQEVCAVDESTISHGYNVAGDDSCGLTAATDHVDVSFNAVGGLRDNGGLPSYFPLAGSPLLDTEPRAVCSVATDQRGISRSVGRGCDSGAIEQIFPSTRFADVAAGLVVPVSWATSTVNGRPLLPARGGGQFQPTARLTRGQAVEALYRSVGSPARPGGCTGATDLNTDAVCWAQATHLMSNVAPDHFRPNQAMTRLQWVRVLHRLSGNAPAAGSHGFVDVALGNADVRWAAANHLASGFRGHRFRPNAVAGRGPAASMLWRLAVTLSAWGLPPEDVMSRSPMVVG
jgi:hypothetical protein